MFTELDYNLFCRQCNDIVAKIDVEGYEYLEKSVAIDLKKTLQNLRLLGYVYGRRKSVSSIWFKMHRKNISFEDIKDVLAFRIICFQEWECYSILQEITRRYEVIENHTKDFIKSPKSNGYKSIHTVLIGPLDKKIEVQIRTQNMHAQAEEGSASHARYKEEKYLLCKMHYLTTW